MILKIIHYSWLTNFFYTNRDLVNWYIQEKKYTIIQLVLNINEISYIKNNYEEFIKILNNILFTYNQVFKVNFNNISFWNVKIENEIYSNCIILFSSKKYEYWYVENNKVFITKKHKKATIYDKIEDLIKNKKLSVRKLMKLWLPQSKARNFYNLLKEKWIIKISEYNNNHKFYDLEKFQKIFKK
jgi:hypothetical protein